MNEKGEVSSKHYETLFICGDDFITLDESNTLTIYSSKYREILSEKNVIYYRSSLAYGLDGYLYYQTNTKSYIYSSYENKSLDVSEYEIFTLGKYGHCGYKTEDDITTYSYYKKNLKFIISTTKPCVFNSDGDLLCLKGPKKGYFYALHNVSKNKTLTDYIFNGENELYLSCVDNFVFIYTDDYYFNGKLEVLSNSGESYGFYSSYTENGYVVSKHNSDGLDFVLGPNGETRKFDYREDDGRKLYRVYKDGIIICTNKAGNIYYLTDINNSFETKLDYKEFGEAFGYPVAYSFNNLICLYDKKNKSFRKQDLLPQIVTYIRQKVISTIQIINIYITNKVY